MCKLQTGISAANSTREIEACIERCLPLAGNDPTYRELVAQSKKRALYELAKLKRAMGLKLSEGHISEIRMMDELWPDLGKE